MTEDGVAFDSKVDGKEVKLKLLTENLDIERKCDTEYHIAYTQLMRKGILPKATLEKQMGDLEIWTKDDEKKLNEIQRDLVDLQIKLEAANTHEEGLAVAKEMGELRANCLKLVEAKAAVLSNSCESLADSIRRDAYLAYATVFADTNKKVFKDYHDFILRAHEDVVRDARAQMLAIATETFQNSLTSLPEVNYVKTVESKIKEESAAQETKTKTEKKVVKKVSQKKVQRKRTTKTN